MSQMGVCLNFATLAAAYNPAPKIDVRVTTLCCNGTLGCKRCFLLKVFCANFPRYF
jgi:hypothetical protein